MKDSDFREIILQAIDHLPAEFKRALQNIEIVIEDRPGPEHLSLFHERKGNWTLLGLYEGVPLNKREDRYRTVLPDKITLFKKTIVEDCNRNDGEMAREIHRTFLHEIGHYFGLSDKRLHELGY